MNNIAVYAGNFVTRLVKRRKFQLASLMIICAFCISLLALYIAIKYFVTQELLDQALFYGFLSNSQVADINNASHNVKHLLKLIFSNLRFTYYFSVIYIYTLILIYVVNAIYNFISGSIKKLKHR